MTQTRPFREAGRYAPPCLRLPQGKEYSQGAHAKHQPDPNLLLPVQLQVPQLIQRYSQHPQVERDADASLDPRDLVDIQAGALVLAVPLGPEEIDGMALEYRD